MSKKKLLISLITVITLGFISWILIRLFYPTYINYRIDNLLSKHKKEIVALYSTQQWLDYYIIKTNAKTTTAPFTKQKIREFYQTYPFIIGGTKVILGLNKLAKENKEISLNKIYKIASELSDKLQFKSKGNIVIVSGVLIKQLAKSNNLEFCLDKDLNKDLFLKNKINGNIENILRTLVTISTYNSLLGGWLGKKDICLKYLNDKSFILYIEQLGQ